MDWTTIIIAAITAVGGGSLGYIIHPKATRRTMVAEASKTQADATNTQEDANKKIFDRYDDFQDRTEKKLQEQENRIQTLEITNRVQFEVIMQAFTCGIIGQHEGYVCPVSKSYNEKIKTTDGYRD